MEGNITVKEQTNNNQQPIKHDSAISSQVIASDGTVWEKIPATIIDNTKNALVAEINSSLRGMTSSALECIMPIIDNVVAKYNLMTISSADGRFNLVATGDGYHKYHEFANRTYTVINDGHDVLPRTSTRPYDQTVYHARVECIAAGPHPLTEIREVQSKLSDAYLDSLNEFSENYDPNSKRGPHELLFADASNQLMELYLNKYNIYPITFGTVIWLHNNVIYTRRSVNANRAAWTGDRVYEDIFYDLMEPYKNVVLDPTKTYSFVLYHPSLHRIALNPNVVSAQGSIYHVATYDNGVVKYDDDIGIPKQSMLNNEEFIRQYNLSKYSININDNIPETLCASAPAEVLFGWVFREKVPHTCKLPHVVIKTELHHILDDTVCKYNTENELFAAMCTMRAEKINKVISIVPQLTEKLELFRMVCKSVIPYIRNENVYEEHIKAMRISIPNWDTDDEDILAEKIRVHPLMFHVYTKGIMDYMRRANDPVFDTMC